MQHSHKFFLLLILFSSFSEIRCGNEQQQPSPAVVNDTINHNPAKDTVTIKPVEKTKPAFNITYHSLTLNNHRMDSLIASDTSRLNIILSLNRIDAKHIWKAKTLVVPDTFLTDLKIYSPFPDSMPELKEVRKLIFFSYPIQAFAAYENGALVRWGPVSMGKRSTPTPVGLFYTNWKAKQTKSTMNDEWVLNWYFNLDNRRGVSMHQYDLPGYPASHACIRLTEDDAYWLYNWADQWKVVHNKIAANGTPVIIFGEYAFGKRKPWLALAENNKATDIDKEELQKEAAQFLNELPGQQSAHDSIPPDLN